MGRNCTVCIHPARSDIDAALETGQPFREIAATYSISKSALNRHWRAHVAGQPSPIASNTETSTRAKRGLRARIFVKWGLVGALGLGILVWTRSGHIGASAKSAT